MKRRFSVATMVAILVAGLLAAEAAPPESSDLRDVDLAGLSHARPHP